jgi:hypothetical protein
MKSVLKSRCGGNIRGYAGEKHEIEEMFKKCFEDCEYFGVDTTDLEFDYRHKDELIPNEKGLIEVTYFSKW